MGQVTRLLRRADSGDRSAMDELMRLVYAELRALAQRQLRTERPSHTLTPTALVHETFLRLAQAEPVGWRSRAHFFAVAARAMRRILVDHARRRLARKRNPDEAIVTFSGGRFRQSATPAELVEIHLALGKLETLYPRPASVVELLLFGGLTHAEVAVMMRVSLSTVQRDWRFAKAWLTHELQPT